MGMPPRELGLQVGIGIKPISYLGTERLVHTARSAMQSVTTGAA